MDFLNYSVVCLAGGVGGAKLADGLAQILPPQRLTIIVNTGDDFRHLGLQICPDLDTVIYLLAAVANQETGWGRAQESWRTITEVGRLGGPDWFRLGDLDLATHLVRSQMLAEGASLTAVIRHLSRQFQIAPRLLPMSDQPAPTQIQSGDTLYAFQTWFVQQRWQPPVTKVVLPEDVRATAAVIQALEQADLVLIAPSNPFVSIDPILNTYPIRAMVSDIPQAVAAVSPIIGGDAVKGPLARMMAQFKMPVSATAVADYYGDLLDLFVYDEVDARLQFASDLPTLCTQTLMKNGADRARLATEIMTRLAQMLTS